MLESSVLFRGHDLAQIAQLLGELVDIVDSLGFVLLQNAVPQLRDLLLHLRDDRVVPVDQRIRESNRSGC